MGLRESKGTHKHASLPPESIHEIQAQNTGKMQNSPHPHVTPQYGASVTPQYGAKTQYAKDDDESPSLSKEVTKYVQAVAGTLLYYVRAVDTTIFTAFSSIATEQVKPTQDGFFPWKSTPESVMPFATHVTFYFY